jgi:hypothetical protein
MALVVIYPEPEKGGRGKKSQVGNFKESLGFSMMRLSQARSLWHDSREMAESLRVRHPRIMLPVRRAKIGKPAEVR